MPRAKSKGPSLATLAIHGAREAHRPGDPVVEPLVQSVNHLQALGTAEGLKYTRYGNTPNADRVQKRIAMLEGAEASLVLSSGMGATACAMLALLRPGDHLLSSIYIYGGTHRLFLEEFAAMGIEVSLVDPFEPRSFRKRIRKETRAIFIESPVNPTCRVIDLRPISYLTKQEGLALVVDSTFASPTCVSTRATLGPTDCGGVPITSSANATFCSAVRSSSRRKSWKTTPSRRRSAGIWCLVIVTELCPATRTSPCDGRSST